MKWQGMDIPWRCISSPGQSFIPNWSAAPYSLLPPSLGWWSWRCAIQNFWL